MPHPPKMVIIRPHEIQSRTIRGDVAPEPPSVKALAPRLLLMIECPDCIVDEGSKITDAFLPSISD